jgi:hypothetical protein
MDLRNWSEAKVADGRKVLSSGFDGARSGQEQFLNGKPLSGFLAETALNALPPAAIGLCIGVLGSYPRSRRISAGRMLVLGLLGGAIGFGASVAWESRHLTAGAAREASKNLSRVRDERWMRKHSIAYA